MSSTLKSVIFWLVVVAAAVGVYQYANGNERAAKAADVAGEWNLSGRADQRCAIFRQGTVLMIVNERGDVASGRVEDGRLVVIKGDGWESGLSAELQEQGKSLRWRDGTVWVRP